LAQARATLDAAPTYPGAFFPIADRAIVEFGDMALFERLLSSRYDQWRMLPFSCGGVDVVRGMIALHIDRVDEAERHYRTGLEWAEREGCPVEVGRNLHGLAQVSARHGNEAEARQQLERAIGILEQYDSKVFLGRALETKKRLTLS
jgi:hypothetical protein